MIHCLIIGKKSEVTKYSLIISKSQFFDRVDTILVDENGGIITEISNIVLFDAILLVSQFNNLFKVFSELIRNRRNVYFVNKLNLSFLELRELEQLQRESENLIFPEFIEINIPLVQEFISVKYSQLLFRYNKSISGKREIIQALFPALCFLSLLSPMQVKKINVNSIETNNTDRPELKIRIKLWDSSVCNIDLKIDNKNENSIILESKNGNFILNITESYLENIHGVRFKSEKITDEELLQKTIDSFAMDIILNKKPSFSFNHYLLSVNILSKIENILNNSF